MGYYANLQEYPRKWQYSQGYHVTSFGTSQLGLISINYHSITKLWGFLGGMGERGLLDSYGQREHSHLGIVVNLARIWELLIG